MEKPTPVLVTLTAPTAAGKSHLLNFIRDEAQLPCLISTTTRAPRANEKEGVDYFFISEQESKEIEANGGFAELAIYRGIRYGVTREEFKNKLDQGVAFLIVEPGGIDHYAKPALDVGALWLKYYVHTDPDVRLSRFMSRAMQDFSEAAAADIQYVKNNPTAFDISLQSSKVFKTYLDRMRAMYTEELTWPTMCKWDRILFGDSNPAENVAIIMNDIRRIRERSLDT